MAAWCASRLDAALSNSVGPRAAIKVIGGTSIAVLVRVIRLTNRAQLTGVRLVLWVFWARSAWFRGC
jgi:hypothetical protein